MIGFMPEIYPDELVYSWLARYHVRSGHTEYKITTYDLFNTDKQKKLNIQFFNNYCDELENIISKYYTTDFLLFNHTMFGVYSKFYSNDFKENAKAYFLKSNRTGRLMVNYITNKYFRYCPLCVQDDRNKYGETYWHVLWQIDGMKVCPIHKCYFINTNLQIYGDGNKINNFEPADTIIPMDISKVSYSNIKAEIDFSKYIAKTIYEKQIEEVSSLKDFLNALLMDTKYRAYGNGLRKIDILLNDLYSFCTKNHFPYINKRILKDIFSVENPYFLNVCLVGYFLKIKPEQLVNRPIKYTKENISHKAISKIIKIANNENMINKIEDKDMSGILKVAEQNYENKKLYDAVIHIFEKKIENYNNIKTNRKYSITINTIRRLYNITNVRLNKFPEIEEYTHIIKLKS